MPPAWGLTECGVGRSTYALIQVFTRTRNSAAAGAGFPRPTQRLQDTRFDGERSLLTLCTCGLCGKPIGRRSWTHHPTLLLVRRSQTPLLGSLITTIHVTQQASKPSPMVPAHHSATQHLDIDQYHIWMSPRWISPCDKQILGILYQREIHTATPPPRV